MRNNNNDNNIFVDKEKDTNTFHEILTDVSMRIIVREGIVRSFIEESFKLETLPESLRQLIELMHKTFASKSGRGGPVIGFNPSNADHIETINTLRDLLKISPVPSLQALATQAFFKFKESGEIKIDRNTLNKIRSLIPAEHYIDKTILSQRVKSYLYGLCSYNKNWVNNFQELYKVLPDVDWFHRSGTRGYVQEIPITIDVFHHPQTNLLSVLSILAKDNTYSITDLTDDELQKCLIAVFLDGSEKQVLDLIKLCIASNKQAALKADYTHDAFSSSFMLLLCLRNIFDEQLFAEMHNEKHKGKIFKLHEEVTCLAAAAYHGNVGLFEWLHKNGHLPDNLGVCLLDHAIRGKQIDMCQYLVTNFNCKIKNPEYLFNNFILKIFEMLTNNEAISDLQVEKLRKLAQKPLSFASKALSFYLSFSRNNLTPYQEACIEYLEIPHNNTCCLVQ